MRPPLPLLIGLLMALSIVTTAPAAEPERTPGGMLRTTLPNGMELLIIENHAAPVAVVNTWFKVGARNEARADEGISHFLEHLLFDGSVGVPLAEFNQILFRNAIDNNASTDQDNTNYYHVGPADKLRDIARMTALLVSQPLLLDSEFDREREVVKEELRQGLDNPAWFLGDLVLPVAMAHTGYDHPVIGDAETLDGQTNDQMRDYYRKYYGPNNAFTIAIGDFRAQDALAILTEEYARWQPTEIAPPPTLQPDTQDTPRSLVGSRDFATNYIAAVWPTVAAKAPDTYALQVLASLLGQGDSSRLVRKLRDELGLVSDISMSTQEMIDQSAFWLQAELVDPAETTHATEEAFRVIADLKTSGPSDHEVERVKRKLILEHLFLGEDVQNQAYLLGYYINATGSPTFFEDYAKRIAGDTAADVQYVAQQYLRPGRITLGLATPDTGASALQPDWSLLGDLAARPRPADLGRLGQDHSPIYPASIADTTSGSALRSFTVGPMQMPMHVRTVPGTGTVGITIASKHGLDRERWETNGLGALLERTLINGTQSYDAEAIAQLIDALGGNLSVTVGYDTTTISGLFASDDYETALQLMRSLITEPTFPEEEVAIAKEILLAEIAARADESYNTTHDHLALSMWGQNSAYGRPPLGRPEVIPTLTREHLTTLAGMLFDPGELVLGISGDIDPGALQQTIEETFAHTAHAGDGAMVNHAVTPGIMRASGVDLLLNRAEKAQAMSVIGLPGVAIDHPDLPALQAVDMVLGGSWLSRLFDRLRGKEGLAYGTYSRVEAYRDGGAITARIGTRPEMWDKAIIGLQREFRLIATEGITQDELDTAVGYARGQAIMAHAGMLAQSQYLAINVALGLPPDHEWQVIGRMQQLTVAEANRVAAAYYTPDDVWLAVTGDISAEMVAAAGLEQ